MKDKSGLVASTEESFIKKEDGLTQWYTESLDEDAQQEMREFTKQTQLTIAGLSVNASNKRAILDGMIALKSNLKALEMNKDNLSREEKDVLNKAQDLLIKFEECLGDRAFKEKLRDPKVCQAWVEMLQNSAIISKDPKNAQAENITRLHEAGMAAQKSFTPKLDALGKAVEYFVLAVVVVVAIAALVYFTGGLRLPFLAAAVPAISSAAATIAGVGATAFTTTVTNLSSIGTGITTVASAHPFIVGTAARAGAASIELASTYLGGGKPNYKKGENAPSTKELQKTPASEMREKFKDVLQGYEKAQKSAQTKDTSNEENKEKPSRLTPGGS